MENKYCHLLTHLPSLTAEEEIDATSYKYSPHYTIFYQHLS